MDEKEVPPKILEYVIKNATKGDVNSVIDTIDYFCLNFARETINVGITKGKHLDDMVKECNPKLALELGAYAGYSALRIARALPGDGKLYSIEIDESHAEVARKMITLAGMENKVTVINGSSQEVLKTLTHKCFDFVFLDHEKTLYKPDLLLLEELKLIHNRSVVAADNIIFPGCPEYLEYVRNSPKYDCQTFMGTLDYLDSPDGIEKSVYKI
uniref:catechol O-methyltransferase n=1 Tax=Phallusia mammillata TaxID=59560 RepID=A0A6F9DKW5_9ASCI|nr:catechol O-methyltransferase-like [Phallusia mammillata]